MYKGLWLAFPKGGDALQLSIRKEDRGRNPTGKEASIMTAYEITMIALISVPLLVRFVKWIVKILDERYKNNRPNH